MSLSIDPVGPVARMEALTDENQRRSEPRPESFGKPGIAAGDIPALAAEKTAAAAAVPLATEPLMLLEPNAHAGYLEAQEFVAKYADEQAAEDADARELVTHHVNDGTAERRLIAERANAHVAERRVAAERANLETLDDRALTERKTEDAAEEPAVAIDVDDDGAAHRGGDQHANAEAADERIVAESEDKDPAERPLVAGRSDDVAAPQVDAERAQSSVALQDAASERAKDDAAAEEAAAARLDAASGKPFNVTA